MSSPFKTKTNTPSETQLHSLPKTMINNYQIVCMHLIDAIYQGMVNSSYQRDGFGILQTHQFDTYLGYFKYNRLHGLGLIVYSDGSIIYGNFVSGQVQGIALTDNSHEMQIGVFSKNGLTGVGFQHNYGQGVWKMSKYHKGVAIETLNEEKAKLDQIPDMLSLESAILKHLIQYKSKRMFHSDEERNDDRKSIIEDVNTFYFHPISTKISFFGALIDNRSEGLGVVYDNDLKIVTEVGMFSDGKLNGYGTKIDQASSRSQFGLYLKGSKEGLFKQQYGKTTNFVVYGSASGMFMDKRTMNLQTLIKQRKLYNYRQKDFFSLRHQTDLEGFKEMFESSAYKAWKLQQLADSSKTHPQQNQTILKPKSKSFSQQGSVAGGATFEKACTQIMREKMSVFSGKQNHKDKSNSQKKPTFKIWEQKQEGKKKNALESEEEKDEIAEEETPISNNPNLTFRKQTYIFSTKYRHL